jgi:gamma-glutamylaminecyclotransferase
MIKFFTYGTFRQGECRHSILQGYTPIFIKTLNTAPEYKLVDLGSFPGMRRGNISVVGELYEVPDDALSIFDMIEGHPSFFRRQEIKLEDGSVAIAYMFQHDSDNEIKSGDWKNR